MTEGRKFVSKEGQPQPHIHCEAGHEAHNCNGLLNLGAQLEPHQKAQLTAPWKVTAQYLSTE